MELIDVEVIGVKLCEGFLQFLLRAGAIPQHGLAGEVHLRAIGAQRIAQLQLSVSVTGRYIEVIDAALDGVGNKAGGRRLIQRRIVAGMLSLATNISFAGKVTVLIAALPLFRDVIAAVTAVVNGS